MEEGGGTHTRTHTHTHTHAHIYSYETQTLRIVTNGFGEYLDTSSLDAALQGLAEIKRIVEVASSGIRIRLAVGEARTADELELVTPALWCPLVWAGAATGCSDPGGWRGMGGAGGC
jgi:hypothetical protein